MPKMKSEKTCKIEIVVDSRYAVEHPDVRFRSARTLVVDKQGSAPTFDRATVKLPKGTLTRTPTGYVAVYDDVQCGFGVLGIQRVVDMNGPYQKTSDALVAGHISSLRITTPSGRTKTIEGPVRVKLFASAPKESKPVEDILDAVMEDDPATFKATDEVSTEPAHVEYEDADDGGPRVVAMGTCAVIGAVVGFVIGRILR